MSYWKNNQTVLNQIIDEVAKVHEWASTNGINGDEYAECCYELVQDVEEKIREKLRKTR